MASRRAGCAPSSGERSTGSKGRFRSPGRKRQGLRVQVREDPPATGDSAGGTILSPPSNLQPATILPTRAQAIRMLHFPETDADTVVAVRRLALDEFVELQRRILVRRRHFETKAHALPCGGG